MTKFLKKYGIAMSEENEPIIKDGSFALDVDITRQAQKFIFLTNIGALVDAPQVGYPFAGILKSKNVLGYVNRYQQQIQLDGQTVDKLEIRNSNEIVVIAGYTE